MKRILATHYISKPQSQIKQTIIRTNPKGSSVLYSNYILFRFPLHRGFRDSHLYLMLLAVTP